MAKIAPNAVVYITIILLSTISLFFPSNASARNLALLIGVSDYQNVPKLQGPRNDVTVMWRILKQNGFSPSDITVLTDGLPRSPEFPVSAAVPTHDAIIKTFWDLAQRVSPGDFVYIHISSHGSRQSSDPGHNAGQAYGNNQVLLPLDTERLPELALAPVANGIPDFELGQMLDQIRKKGARIWIVVDMCFAGDSTRQGGLISREIDPSILNVALADPRSPSRDESLLAIFDRRPLAQAEAIATPIVAFFAVDPREVAYEKSFPGYQEPLVGSNTLGAFTYALSRALTSSNSTTYRDLADKIVANLQSGAVGDDMPLPVFSGPLDAPIFSRTAPLHSGWAVLARSGKLQIDAGGLAGATKGSTVDIYRNSSDIGAPIGSAKITASGLSSSIAVFDESPSTHSLIENEKLWAQLRHSSPNYKLRIAEPPATDMATDSSFQLTASNSIVQLKALIKQSGSIAVEWVDSSAVDVDFRLRLSNGRIWIAPSTMSLIAEVNNPFAPASISIADPALTSMLFDTIWRNVRARILVRTASAYSASKLLEEKLYLYRPANQSPSEYSRCPSASAYRELIEHDENKSPVVGNAFNANRCDLITVELYNRRNKYLDADVFYVDARGGITRVSTLKGCAIELAPQSTTPARFPILIFFSSDGVLTTAGKEHIVVIATERKDGSPPTCYDGLTAQSLRSVKDYRNVQRSDQSSFISLINNGVALVRSTMADDSEVLINDIYRSYTNVYTIYVGCNDQSTLNNCK